jgi:thymidylate synthase
MRSTIKQLRNKLINEGYEVESQSWQGSKPLDTMVEILHTSVIIPMTESLADLDKATNPRLPWANEHFEERVGGKPLNPPPSFMKWNSGPRLHNFFCKTSNNSDDIDAKFSHSYPERLWSKGLHTGIRYNIADLNTLVQVLKKDPTTRQAFLPFFFPEDLTAALQGERVPCSLGWHFIVRNGKLDVMYSLRSCDAFRHLHHDIYFTNRLAQWVKAMASLDVELGNIHLVITSLHCFKADIDLYKKGLI